MDLAEGQAVETRDVVPGVVRVHPVLEQHRLLPCRQRERVGDRGNSVVATRNRLAGQSGGHDGGEFADRSAAEHRRIVEVGAVLDVDRGHHLERIERGATEIEEVVGDTDAVETEHVAPDLAATAISIGVAGATAPTPCRWNRIGAGEQRWIGLRAGGEGHSRRRRTRRRPGSHGPEGVSAAADAIRLDPDRCRRSFDTRRSARSFVFGSYPTSASSLATSASSTSSSSSSSASSRVL